MLSLLKPTTNEIKIIIDYGVVTEQKKYKLNRKCRVCKIPLSQYNPNKFCHCCLHTLIMKDAFQSPAAFSMKAIALKESLRN